jgi:hypothetical protein
MPLASDASAASVVVPDSVAPEAGAVSATVGGVPSPAGVVTASDSEAGETLPAAS